ncbi:MAG TPA: LacI family transcriptional regulator [Propionibacterium sp.]|nr:LacI family transcriptional regulator [Propionibacterium sp.]
MAELLASGREFDGLVCGNDGVALGAIHALRLAGLRVPQDVAVMGWDDAMAGRYANPTLSTVRPDSVQLVRLAFNKLLTRIDGDSSPYEEIVIPHELVIRESTSGHPHPGKPDDGA